MCSQQIDNKRQQQQPRYATAIVTTNIFKTNSSQANQNIQFQVRPSLQQHPISKERLRMKIAESQARRTIKVNWSALK